VAAPGLAPHQKGARRAGRLIVFVDETGHSFLARFGPTWAPRGQPPVLRRVSQRRELSSIAALVAPVGTAARLVARHFPGTIRGPQVTLALQAFHRRLGHPLVVIWDRLSAHKSREVTAFLAAHPGDYQIEWLPAYAPDLNPEELCNGWVKREIQNAVPGSVAELHHQVRRSFRRLARRPTLLRSFFDHTGLDVTDHCMGH
jgi:transposase